MKIKILLSYIIIGGIFLNVNAQGLNENAGETVQNKLRTDEIFNDIMQSLPADVKSKVDSIKTVSQNKGPYSFQNQSTPEMQKMMNRNMENISKELRAKIEKAMNEIDMQKQKRQMQFKENKKK